MPTRVPMVDLRLRFINIALLLRATLAAWGGDPLAQNIACYTTEVDETFIDFDGELKPLATLSRFPTEQTIASHVLATSRITGATILHNNLGGWGCSLPACDPTSPSLLCPGETIDGPCLHKMGASCAFEHCRRQG